MWHDCSQTISTRDDGTEFVFQDKTECPNGTGHSEEWSETRGSTAFANSLVHRTSRTELTQNQL